MNTFRLAPLAAAAVVCLAACTRPEASKALGFQKGRKLVYEVRDAEEAPHPVLGFGGKVLARTRVELSVVGVNTDGSADIEATLPHLSIDGPPAAGIQVDTSAKMPLPADKTGANSVVLSLVPQTALLRVTRLGHVEGRPNGKAVAHVAAWAGTLPPASGPVAQRIAERIDPVLATQLVFGSVEQLLRRESGVDDDKPWRAVLPLVDTPAGKIGARATVTWTRVEGALEIRAKGDFTLVEPAPDAANAEFVSGTADMFAKLDRDGVLVHARDTTRITLRTRDASKTETVWVRDHIVNLGPEPKR